jgi:ribosomal protein L40E
MEYLFFWIVFCIVVAIVAKNKGRSGFAWFFLSFLISPLLALILVLALKPVVEEVVVEEVGFDGTRDLTNDAYKLFLSKKYEIQKNDVFDKFVCQEKMYPTIDEALIYAHDLEQESVAIKKSKKLEDGQIECSKCSGKNPAESSKCRYCSYTIEI